MQRWVGNKLITDDNYCHCVQESPDQLHQKSLVIRLSWQSTSETVNILRLFGRECESGKDGRLAAQIDCSGESQGREAPQAENAERAALSIVLTD